MRRETFRSRFEEWQDPVIPKFHYGTHYSSAGVVLYYLIRLEPYTQHSLNLQGGKFDHADRLFSNVRECWSSASHDNMSDVKELIPEPYYLPDMFVNRNMLNLGFRQHEGQRVHDVILPPWAREDPVEFVRLNRLALESPYVSENLHKWIDLIFGAAQQGPDQLDAHHVRFVPGLNEDLAATAIWGTQQLGVFPGARYDGVFGIWYGKGPGVDRSGDALRHANQAGSANWGGVLAVAGDDHGAKSSTMAAQTDFVFQAVGMPVLAPATVQDYLDYGLHGFAMSRFAGLWIGMKAVTDTIEVAGVVDVSAGRPHIVLPDDAPMPPGGLNLRWPEESFLKLEERLARWKLPAALAYARANRLDAHVFGRRDGEPARLGIVSTGKSWLDVMQALLDLGIDEASARAAGLKVWKVAMPWPLEAQGLRGFAAGCEELLVVEEKRALIEAQLKEALYPLAERPRVVGKTDEQGAPLVPDYGEITPASCARLIAARLKRWEGRAADARGALPDELVARLDAQLARLDAKEHRVAPLPATIERIPYFCSGCPHNTSTRVPEGSRALAGIGCHTMAMWMDRSTATFTHMGGEGVTWVGQAPFSDTKHVFQNLGDGTWFHSGSLAIRHAVATRTPITYKILFNDAVAMTGGQKHDGQITPRLIAQQVRAEGVGKVVVVTDEPDKYPAGHFDAEVAVRHRGRLDEVQRELREYPDVSVLIYDQTCAAEKRRRRKRGEFPDPPRRVFINEAVCEGCGDCGVQSNCVVDRTGRDRVRAQARDQPVVVQQGLLLRRGVLPELRHRARRTLAPQQRDRSVAAGAARRRRRPGCRRRSCR